MPIRVPESDAQSFGQGAKPSEVDLWMSLATMDKLGRIANFDERFSGQPPGLPIDVQSKGGPVSGRAKGSVTNPNISMDPEKMPNKALDFTDPSPDQLGPARVQKVKRRG